MNTNSLVSIVVPAYNAQDHIAETIDSIINQTYSSIEVFLINDGSTDNTQSIIDSFSTKYPEKIISLYQENAGVSATRNKSIQLVNGEYIAFVDADDILLPNYIEKLVGASKKTNSEVSVCGYEKFKTKSGEVFYEHNPANWLVEFYPGKEYVFQYSPWAKLFKTDFLRKYGILFGINEILEDGPFSIATFLLTNSIALVDEVLYRYRYDDTTSTMGSVRKKNSAPQLPYNAIKLTVNTVRKYKNSIEDEFVLEYCIVKALTGYATNMGKSINKETRKQLCDYCYHTIKDYFPNVAKNPYIKLNALKNTPFSHRMAIKLFVVAYKLKMLYPFSLIVSKVL